MGLQLGQVTEALKALAGSGRLVRISKEFYLHSEHVRQVCAPSGLTLKPMPS